MHLLVLTRKRKAIRGAPSKRMTWSATTIQLLNITQILENADGTKTLLASCLSTDIPTDCLFSHELTVRDLPGGGFQFVSNRVTFQTGLGLPNDAPRLRAK